MLKSFLVTLTALSVVAIVFFAMVTSCFNQQEECEQNECFVPDKVTEYCLSGGSTPIDSWLQVGKCANQTCSFTFQKDVKLVKVNGMSMSPTGCNGDYAVLMEVDPEDIKVGHIVSYEQGNDLISHRVVDTCDGGFVTKGDLHLATDDGCIKKEQIKYVQVAVLRK